MINNAVILSIQRRKTVASFTSIERHAQKINKYPAHAVSIFHGVFVQTARVGDVELVIDRKSVV